MTGSVRQRSGTAALSVIAAVAGLVSAVIVVLNLHIAAGLEQGYAASPREVWDRSPLLGLTDVALLVGGPLLALFLVAKVRRHGDAGGKL